MSSEKERVKLNLFTPFLPLFVVIIVGCFNIPIISAKDLDIID
ncbi:MAG: hypothetical protein QM657_01250 [Lacrimispora sp.]